MKKKYIFYVYVTTVNNYQKRKLKMCFNKSTC